MSLSSLSRLITVIILTLTGLGSCVSQKKLPYLQNPAFTTQQATTIDNTPSPYRLQNSDIISIRVQSAQAELNTSLNITGSQTLYSSEPGVLYLSGYSVDERGQVTLPTAGKVKVQGLTLDEAQNAIQKAVALYVRDATVLVKLLSFKVTILGEVRTPGRYFIYSSQATLLEALGMAGDLTEFGNRENVKLVRQTPKGSEVVLLNLTDPNLLKSPYYYLMPNDALYVEPLKARSSRANINNLGIVFSGISAVALILSFFVNN
ncbi:polysaccharide biosynthesis/export family protein [Hymenobacter sp.]|jgi:polysaccharide export outer membrane protein|uniref:polysaccharide biosynthesis/export family protein n=1 Tax=Hymenobacter sp. TaxID=1898978 RepID=UPI002EDB7DA7